MKYSDEQRDQAKKLYLDGNSVPEIEQQLGIERRSIYNWIKAENWNAGLYRDDPLATIRRRVRVLVERENKTALELDEIDRLIGHLDKLEKMRIRTAESSIRTADDAPGESGEKTERKRDKKPKKNDFTQIDDDELLEKFKEGLFAYQLDCWAHLDEKIRNILKSRQIGMTFYFAREAFTNALLTGDNQIFISASRAQADVFRQYIKAFAREWYGVELKGKDTIELVTKHGVATLYFLSTNTSTAQSYHGHLYIDEYFWIPKFDVLKKVATGMASQKKWRITLFSTPSAKSHCGYTYWSGDDYNERMKRSNKPLAVFAGRDAIRKEGVRGPDLQWRRIITIQDAEAGGCDLFDLEQLKIMFSEDEFRQLFECYFIDDTASVFKFTELEKCLGDREEFKGFDFEAAKRWLGPVWIGYDPSRNRDGACIVVIAAPLTHRGQFLVLEKISLHNAAWQYQANIIKELRDFYNVEHIAIDITGPGSGVYEMVTKFYPAAEALYYTPELKTKLVLKAQQVIGDNRIVWDASWSDIAAGFMQIHRGANVNGTICYFASRSDLTGHADAAWAIMNALAHEDLVLPDDGDKCSWAFAA